MSGLPNLVMSSVKSLPIVDGNVKLGAFIPISKAIDMLFYVLTVCDLNKTLRLSTYFWLGLFW